MNKLEQAAPRLCAVLVTGALSLSAPAFGQWNTYAHDAQHDAQSPVASQVLSAIHWQTPVDLHPKSSGGELLIHYGSPLVTAANTVIVPVKTGLLAGFEVQAINVSNGRTLWTQTSDYILPPHNWVPIFGPALTSAPRLYYPGAGGTVYYRDSPDSARGTTGQLAFYGIGQYTNSFLSMKAFQDDVLINTPISADSAGNIYFGFIVQKSLLSHLVVDQTGKPLVSGIARISVSGVGTWTPVTTAAGDQAMTEVAQNCDPAVSLDGSKLYLAVSNGQAGYLVELDSATLAPIAKVKLIDPESGKNADISDDASSSPTVGPDGDVYYGVLENPCCENNDRGWLLHFSGDLSTKKTTGAFGWDDTPSIVPTAAVPSYTGSSPYLLMTKYNNYAGAGTGNGENKIAILDPDATEVDPITGQTVMKEILTILGPTPEGNGVKEWCINSAAVDPATKSILANSEDGTLYRWDLTTNTLSQKIVLTAGIGEAYTPTLVAVDGTVFAINDATLFAVGQ